MPINAAQITIVIIYGGYKEEVKEEDNFINFGEKEKENESENANA